MMWGYQNAAGYGGAGFFGAVWFLMVLVVFIDLVLLGIWLWKNIGKK